MGTSRFGRDVASNVGAGRRAEAYHANRIRPCPLTCRSTNRDNAPQADNPRGMSQGPDGDDEDLVDEDLVEIDLVPAGPPPLPPDHLSELASDLVVEPEDNTEPNRAAAEPPA